MLQRIYIDNYRCFVDFEWRPGRRNLLIGDNGTGKTSLFDALAGLQDLIAFDRSIDRSRRRFLPVRSPARPPRSNKSSSSRSRGQAVSMCTRYGSRTIP
jgi:predicted ATP-binding protein involved in virulence